MGIKIWTRRVRRSIWQAEIEEGLGSTDVPVHCKNIKLPRNSSDDYETAGVCHYLTIVSKHYAETGIVAYSTQIIFSSARFGDTSVWSVHVWRNTCTWISEGLRLVGNFRSYLICRHSDLAKDAADAMKTGQSKIEQTHLGVRISLDISHVMVRGPLEAKWRSNKLVDCSVCTYTYKFAWRSLRLNHQ